MVRWCHEEGKTWCRERGLCEERLARESFMERDANYGGGRESSRTVVVAMVEIDDGNEPKRE